jgi:hypothetical protein
MVVTEQKENTGEGQYHPKGHLAKQKAEAAQALKDTEEGLEEAREKLKKKSVKSNKLAG